MSHLNTAYQLGALDAQHAFEKQAVGGLFSGLLRSTTKALRQGGAARSGVLKQLGSGAAIGAVPGAIAGGANEGGFGGALQGALLGGATGAVGGRMLGRQMQTATRAGLGQRYANTLRGAQAKSPFKPDVVAGRIREMVGPEQAQLLEATSGMAFPSLRRVLDARKVLGH